MIKDGVKVVQLVENWFYTQEGGEAYTSYEVGRNCLSIEYNEPSGPGDAHFCDVLFADRKTKRVFNINSVSYEPVDPKQTGGARE